MHGYCEELQRGADLHDMAAEAVLHDALEAAPGDALQQAVIPFLFGPLGAQHGRNQGLQGFPAKKNMPFHSTESTTKRHKFDLRAK